MSRSAIGLQNAINKTKIFYDSLGLEVNKKNSKVMIFNGRGLKLDTTSEHQFTFGSNNIEVVDVVIVAKKAKAPVDYSKDNKEAWDNLLLCNQYKEIFNLKKKT